jgi:LacI family transcriptional regulator, galactose operon repressor
MTSRRRPTLSDVAARAGVSVTTASYILNRRSKEMRISADAAQRVQTAAAELEYRPNRNARNLRSSSTATIGVITDHVAGGAYASRMLTGAASAARARNHLLVIGESEGDPDLERLLIEEMLDRQVDGIVYATLATSSVTVPPGLRKHRTVLLNCVDVEGQLPAVVPDELDGGRTAARAVLESGHRHGIYVVGEEHAPGIAGALRMQGIRRRLAEEGCSLAGVVETSWSVRPAYDAVTALLARGMQPGALVCLNDRIAMGAYEALGEHGLRVPQDASVVSFDGSELAGWLRPTLTSVRIPYAELGERAVESLMGGSQAVELLAMPLVRGGSIGQPHPTTTGAPPLRT